MGIQLDRYSKTVPFVLTDGTLRYMDKAISGFSRVSLKAMKANIFDRHRVLAFHQQEDVDGNISESFVWQKDGRWMYTLGGIVQDQGYVAPTYFNNKIGRTVGIYRHTEADFLLLVSLTEGTNIVHAMKDSAEGDVLMSLKLNKPCYFPKDEDSFLQHAMLVAQGEKRICVEGGATIYEIERRALY